jgi:hypothetical protein
MSRYIGQYTATCDLCLRTKVLRQPPTGHLESLPTPDIRWDTISVDFIVKLLESDRYDVIMVVVAPSVNELTSYQLIQLSPP